MTVHQLKVTLAGVSPPVWRRLHVPSGTTLGALHEVLQAAMGWEGHHLHCFEVGWDRYGDGEGESEVAVTVGAVLPKAGGAMVYTYDFGDDWHHVVEVEKIHQTAPASATRVARPAGGLARPRTAGGLTGISTCSEHCGPARAPGTGR